MLNFFKINSEQEIEWVEDEGPSSFIIVVAVLKGTCGYSTFIYTNGTKRDPILKRMKVIGHHTLNVIAQFDVKTETGVCCLNTTMRLVGRKALRVFLDSNPHRCFAYSDLQRIADAGDVALLTDDMPATPPPAADGWLI